MKIDKSERLLEVLEKIKRRQARKAILHKLSSYGINWNDQKRHLEVPDLRDTQLRLARLTNGNANKFDDKVKSYFAQPAEIDPMRINPYLVEVKSNELSGKIWSYAMTFWSVPVSAGYGRRLRFIVFDRQNNKVIGVFGLCDPLIGSTLRDNFVGWNREQKIERLYNCLTAYVLGSVPPYNTLLGSKLVALCAMLPEVRTAFRKKYVNNETIISGKKKIPELVMIDTYGAFQKSSIYTRLLNWNFVDYTQGKSHLHITANGSWEIIKEFVPKEKFSSYAYGQGSNWKLRTLIVGLENLGFNNDGMLTIGWKRAYYTCPLAVNWREFLTMKDAKPKFIKYSRTELVTYWRTRWLLPRLDRLLERLGEV
ncbi:Druantia anti-phage system protein DruA [Tellurirhabdus bombi]|uniref:Druantia anti-phage system protein DruA n=1 Tax=Tellurirhabdus bombi TaxID=2907205 RepID=UPI001F392053|nr:Druantia anti-phage system protein DruA [Tellurirhabdus bombi]